MDEPKYDGGRFDGYYTHGKKLKFIGKAERWQEYCTVFYICYYSCGMSNGEFVELATQDVSQATAWLKRAWAETKRFHITEKRGCCPSKTTADAFKHLFRYGTIPVVMR